MSARDATQRLALNLTRRRHEWTEKVERIEGEEKGRTAAYERGCAYGLSVAINAVQAEADSAEAPKPDPSSVRLGAERSERK